MPPEEEIDIFDCSLFPPEDFDPDPPSMPPEDATSADNSTDSGKQLHSDSSYANESDPQEVSDSNSDYASKSEESGEQFDSDSAYASDSDDSGEQFEIDW